MGSNDLPRHVEIVHDNIKDFKYEKYSRTMTKTVV